MTPDEVSASPEILQMLVRALQGPMLFELFCNQWPVPSSKRDAAGPQKAASIPFSWKLELWAASYLFGLRPAIQFTLDFRLTPTAQLSAPGDSCRLSPSKEAPNEAHYRLLRRDVGCG
jgi:hypothetical protein